jgi:hypothetical protein
MKFINLFLISFLLPVTSSAKTEVVTKGEFIYYKTPFSEFRTDEQKKVVKRSLEVLLSHLKQNFKKITKDDSLSSKTLKNIPIAEAKIDDIADTLEKFANRGEDFQSITSGARPTGYMIVLGGKMGMKVGGPSGGLSGLIAIVLLPVKIHKVDVLTQEVDTYYMMKPKVVMIPAVGIGASGGAGAGAAKPASGTFRIGAGLIWGKLESADDFVGIAAGLSGSYMLSKVKKLPGGINVKAAVLKGKKAMNPFMIVSYEAGMASTAEMHFNAMPIFPAETLTNGLITGIDMSFEDRDKSKPEADELIDDYGTGDSEDEGETEDSEEETLPDDEAILTEADLHDPGASDPPSGGVGWKSYKDPRFDFMK